MTNATIHPLHPRAHALTLPRSPLKGEMSEAGEAACAAYQREDKHAQAYWQGVFIGYALAFDMVNHDYLNGIDPLARTGTADELLAATSPIFMFTDWERTKKLLRDCGVLWGYWQGTSENMDAEQCLACGRRICTSVDPFVPCFAEAAVVCNGTCHDEAHRGFGPEAAARRCVEAGR